MVTVARFPCAIGMQFTVLVTWLGEYYKRSWHVRVLAVHDNLWYSHGATWIPMFTLRKAVYQEKNTSQCS